MSSGDSAARRASFGEGMLLSGPCKLKFSGSFAPPKKLGDDTVIFLREGSSVTFFAGEFEPDVIVVDSSSEDDVDSSIEVVETPLEKAKAKAAAEDSKKVRVASSIKEWMEALDISSSEEEEEKKPTESKKAALKPKATSQMKAAAKPKAGPMAAQKPAPKPAPKKTMQQLADDAEAGKGLPTSSEVKACVLNSAHEAGDSLKDGKRKSSRRRIPKKM